MDTLVATSMVLLWLVVLVNFLLTLALIKKINSQSNLPGGPKKGNLAPYFEAKTLSDGISSIEDFMGSKSLFVFISPTCKPCHELLPHFIEVGKTLQNQNVKFALIVTAELEQAQSLVNEFNISLPVLVAPNSSNFIKTYKIYNTPFYCLIAKNGIVEATGFPGISNATWKTLVHKWNISLDNYSELTVESLIEA